ncbi:MAG TPA: group III truncated hemoglobin [Flavobacteriales bacterium]|nr:group III truncated hemoglobin [Flavobacteriales bacterium]
MRSAPRTDIQHHDHIVLLVDSFYGRVRNDELLGGIFNGIIGDCWPEHLEKMHRFWSTVLINEVSYTGTPLRPHLHMPIGAVHFQRWLTLFLATVDDLFEGPVADLAKRNALRMADMFQERINRHRTRPQDFIQ